MSETPEMQGQRGEGGSSAVAMVAGMPALAFTITQIHVTTSITIDEPLAAAYQAASSPHTLRALQSDLEAFDSWCRAKQRIALPALPETVADYLDDRADKGSKHASLGCYKASIAKIHQLLDLTHSSVAYSTASKLRHATRRWITSAL